LIRRAAPKDLLMSQLKPRLISISKSGLSEPKTADLNLRIDASAVMGMATSAASARTAAEHGAGLKLTAMESRLGKNFSQPAWQWSDRGGQAWGMRTRFFQGQ
jgi:hypothetical protein